MLVNIPKALYSNSAINDKNRWEIGSKRGYGTYKKNLLLSASSEYIEEAGKVLTFEASEIPEEKWSFLSLDGNEHSLKSYVFSSCTAYHACLF